MFCEAEKEHEQREMPGCFVFSHFRIFLDCHAAATFYLIVCRDDGS